MKKLLVIPLLVLFLAGCGKKTALETISDIEDVSVIASAQRIQIQLPPELSSPTMESEENGALYLCDDYSVTVQVTESGDLQKTIREATGQDKKNLQIMQTKQGGVKRYQWVWTTTGENGTQVGRCCLLDDGAYHYVLTALTDEGKTEKVQSQWKEIFTSFTLATEREEISTGS